MTNEQLEGELRNQIAGAYALWTVTPYDPTQGPPKHGFSLADALLTGPLAPLLAKLLAVEELADHWDHFGIDDQPCAEQIRQALEAT